MSIENHKIKRNQELNRDLMKRWGFSLPESTEEPADTEIDGEKQPDPVVESSAAVRSLIIEAAEEAGVKFEENEIDEIINEMIDEGFFDSLKDLGAAAVGDPLSRMAKGAGGFISQKASGVSGAMAQKKIDRLSKKAQQDLERLKSKFSNELGKSFLGLGKVDFESDERLKNLRDAFEILEKEIPETVAQFVSSEQSEEADTGGGE
tara:strand:+ start:1361 stop:1978 length:618 start_codon:yes stop_codon:yes gene_type:complete